MSARAVAHALFRRRRLVLASLAGALALAGAGLALVPPEYRAEATWLVEAGGPAEARALAALLESRDLHRQVLAGPVPWPDPDSFAASLNVRPEPGSALVHVSLDGPDAAQAKAALERLLAGMREKNQLVFAPAADVDGTLEAKAAEARRKLADFRRQHGLFDAQAEQGGMVARRGALEGQAIAAEAEGAALADKLAALQRRLAATPATIALSTSDQRSRAAEDARAKLFELEAREAELLNKYTDTSAFVRNLRAEKDKVRKLLAELDGDRAAVTSGANPVHQDLTREAGMTEAALSSAKARARTARAQLAELDRRLAGLSGHARSLAELEREVAAAEARLGGGKAGPAIAGIGMVQQADATSRPLGPSPRRVLGLAAALGLALGLVLVALAERFSARFSTPAEIERRLGLPVLTSIPRES